MEILNFEKEKLNIVGRICCDVSGGARLNATSLLLEGSDETCSALSVPLDVGRVADYSLFPGQIVAARATNPTGRRIVVDNIFTPAIQATPKNDEPIIDESTGIFIFLFWFLFSFFFIF